MRLPRILVPIILAIAALVAPSVTAHATFTPHIRPLAEMPSTAVCTRGPIRCDARVVRAARSHISVDAVSPATLHTAYNLPSAAPTHQTIAIVDAGGYATAESDLAAFDAANNLPACTMAKGCLQIVNEYGKPSPLPASQGWEVEEALDLQAAHSICQQNCSLLLVEATQASTGDLCQAEQTAANMGATEISNSWGGPEGQGVTCDATFDRPGIAITVSAGDSAYGVSWPAVLNTVLSVGGTQLQVNADGSYAAESVWYDPTRQEGTGSGCSSYVPALRWQTSNPNWTAINCGTNRSDNDVAADADPTTGLTLIENGQPETVGGTSLSSPIMAAVIALAGGMANVGNPAAVPYLHGTDGSFHDVVAGVDGTCNYLSCRAGEGLDGPTGFGSPNGVTGFQGGAIAPTPSPTAVPTNTPTPVPPTATPTPIVPTPTSTIGLPPPPPKCLWWVHRHGREKHGHCRLWSH